MKKSIMNAQQFGTYIASGEKGKLQSALYFALREVMKANTERVNAILRMELLVKKDGKLNSKGLEIKEYISSFEFPSIQWQDRNQRFGHRKGFDMTKAAVNGKPYAELVESDSELVTLKTLASFASDKKAKAEQAKTEKAEQAAAEKKAKAEQLRLSPDAELPKPLIASELAEQLASFELSDIEGTEGEINALNDAVRALLAKVNATQAKLIAERVATSPEVETAAAEHLNATTNNKGNVSANAKRDTAPSAVKSLANTPVTKKTKKAVNE